MVNNRKSMFYPFLLISVSLHVLIALVISQVTDFSKDSIVKNEDRPLKIKSFKRTIGIKNGVKDYDVNIKKQLEKDQLDFSALKVNQNQKIQPKRVKKLNQPTKVDQIDFSISKRTKNQKRNQKRFLKKISQERFLDPVLANSDFALNPELPKGIKEDELNSAEKIYYSFKKRTLEQYLASFVDKYQNMKKSRPSIKNKLISKKHKLSGRIVFDKNGHILAIKIIKSSEDDAVHELFEETLKGINKVPNPPADFLTADDKFTIYYVLQIN